MYMYFLSIFQVLTSDVSLRLSSPNQRSSCLYTLQPITGMHLHDCVPNIGKWKKKKIVFNKGKQERKLKT